MPTPPYNPQPILTTYILTRWCCVRCGWFETGEIIGLHATNCPECQMPAIFADRCEGRTTHKLPFVSKPRKESTPEMSFQVTHAKGIVEKLGSDARARRRAGLKATGRKRKVQP